MRQRKCKSIQKIICIVVLYHCIYPIHSLFSREKISNLLVFFYVINGLFKSELFIVTKVFVNNKNFKFFLLFFNKPTNILHTNTYNVKQSNINCNLLFVLEYYSNVLYFVKKKFFFYHRIFIPIFLICNGICENDICE